MSSQLMAPALFFSPGAPEAASCCFSCQFLIARHRSFPCEITGYGARSELQVESLSVHIRLDDPEMETERRSSHCTCRILGMAPKREAGLGGAALGGASMLFCSALLCSDLLCSGVRQVKRGAVQFSAVIGGGAGERRWLAAGSVRCVEWTSAARRGVRRVVRSRSVVKSERRARAHTLSYTLTHSLTHSLRPYYYDRNALARFHSKPTAQNIEHHTTRAAPIRGASPARSPPRARLTRPTYRQGSRH